MRICKNLLGFNYNYDKAGNFRPYIRQGSQVDIGGALPEILAGIVENIPEPQVTGIIRLEDYGITGELPAYETPLSISADLGDALLQSVAVSFAGRIYPRIQISDRQLATQGSFLVSSFGDFYYDDQGQVGTIDSILVIRDEDGHYGIGTYEI